MLHTRVMPSPFAEQLDMPPVPHEGLAPSPKQLLLVARGFSCIFWGIALSFLLLSGVLNIRGLTTARMPAHVLGVAILLLGAIWLRRVRPLTHRWTRRANALLAAVVIQLYMIPFVAWWRELPHVTFYSLNIVLLFVATAWLLVLLNSLAAEVGRANHNKILLVEARLCGWTAPMLLATPLVFLALQAAFTMQRAGASVNLDLLRVTLIWPSWINALILIPFVLTLSIVWETRRVCLARINAARS